MPGKDELNAEELKIVAEFLGAVRGNPGPVNTGLEFSVPLAKTLMLANMLAFAGKGTYGFDGEKTDSAVANARAKHGYRKGRDPFAQQLAVLRFHHFGQDGAVIFLV